MPEQLSWEKIKATYDQEWVLLTDHDWPEGNPHPASGVVRVHAHSKKEFDKAMKASVAANPKNFAVVYVGKPSRKPNDFHINLFTLTTCE